MTGSAIRATFKSPLHEMTQTTPTCLWNDSASIQELTYSLEHGAVGATCNPVIVLGVLKKEMSLWKERIQSLIKDEPNNPYFYEVLGQIYVSMARPLQGVENHVLR